MRSLVLKLSLILILISFSIDAQKVCIAFRNDDLSAKSDPTFEYEVIRIFQKYGIVPLYAIIPAFEGKYLKNGMPIVDSLKVWKERGWIELAQHGYRHDKILTEFPFDEQKRRISAGKKILETLFGQRIDLFCPPVNAADNNTFKALQDVGFYSFSGYLGESGYAKIRKVNCNSNLFEGPLGSLDSVFPKHPLKSDALLVPLFHSSYDFEKNSLSDLDKLLGNLIAHSDVKIVSFGELLNDSTKCEFLDSANQAGYYYEFLKGSKFMRKIILQIPFVSTYLYEKIDRVKVYYYSGRYGEVFEIFSYLKISFFVVIFCFFLLLFIIVRYAFVILKTRL